MSFISAQIYNVIRDRESSILLYDIRRSTFLWNRTDQSLKVAALSSGCKSDASSVPPSSLGVVLTGADSAAGAPMPEPADSAGSALGCPVASGSAGGFRPFACSVASGVVVDFEGQASATLSPDLFKCQWSRDRTSTCNLRGWSLSRGFRCVPSTFSIQIQIVSSDSVVPALSGTFASLQSGDWHFRELWWQYGTRLQRRAW